MRKVIAIILITFITLYSASSFSFASIDSLSIANLQLTGNDYSISNFNEIFCKEPSIDNDATLLDGESAENSSSHSSALNITNLRVLGNTISFKAQISTINGIISFSSNGSLYSSSKSEKNVNSVVAKLDTITDHENFELSIKYFEIFNDTSSDSLLSTQSINGKPHIKIYLVDNQNRIYLFEQSLPKKLEGINSINYSIAEPNIDVFWFVGIAKPIFSGELTTSATELAELGLSGSQMMDSKTNLIDISMDLVVPMALNSFSTWVYPSTFYFYTYVGSDLYQYWSLPYFEYKHVNVSSSDSTWIASFQIAEHWRINGTTWTGNQYCWRPFRYENIHVSMTAGGKTTFIRSYQDGRIVEKGSWNIKQLGSSIALKIYKKVLSSIPYAATISEVLSWVAAAVPTSTTATLGSSGTTLFSRSTISIGSKIGTAYEMFICSNLYGVDDSGHYYTLHGVLQYESTTNTPAVTNGNFRLSFTVADYSSFSADPVLSNKGPYDFNLTYTSAP